MLQVAPQLSPGTPRRAINIHLDGTTIQTYDLLWGQPYAHSNVLLVCMIKVFEAVTHVRAAGIVMEHDWMEHRND